MIIGVDCDGVLTDMSAYIYEYGEKYFKRKPSNLDGYSTAEIFDCSMAAEHLMNNRLMKKAFIALGGIPVDRTGNTAPAIERALHCLKNDKCFMLIHPEGTRTRTGKLGEFKQGAAKLSIESGVKIIPVCINGAYEIFPPNRKLPRLFDWKHFCKYQLKIQFGTPIEPQGKNAAEITEEIKRQIVEMKKQ